MKVPWLQVLEWAKRAAKAAASRNAPLREEPGLEEAESTEKMLHGIDVSHHQKGIDWDTLVGHEDFVYFKATEGVDYIDPTAVEKSEEAQKRSLRFGFYHFATPGMDDAEDEANDFCDFLDHYDFKAMLPPVLDLEQNRENLSGPGMVQWVLDFVQVVRHRTGRTVILYGSPGVLDGYFKNYIHSLGKNMPLWVAHYTNAQQPRLPKGWDTWLMWQYKDTGTVEGYHKNIDVNRARGSLLTMV